MSMRTTLLARVAGVVLVMAPGLGACDSQTAPKSSQTAPPVETSPLTLALRAAPATALGSAPGVVAADVSYTHKADKAAPRMMELYLAYDAGLTFDHAEPLAATTAAGKELVVQDKGGRLRVIVYASSNTTTLGSGALARFFFRAPDVNGAKGGTVSLESKMPIFAPAEANDGLLLGPPVTLSPGQGAP